MTKIDKAQLEKISGGADAAKSELQTESGQTAQDQPTIQRAGKRLGGGSPAIVTPVVRPGEADD